MLVLPDLPEDATFNQIREHPFRGISSYAWPIHCNHSSRHSMFGTANIAALHLKTGAGYRTIDNRKVYAVPIFL